MNCNTQPCALPPTLNRLTVRNNLVYDSNDHYAMPDFAYAFVTLAPGLNATFDHNTIIHQVAPSSTNTTGIAQTETNGSPPILNTGFVFKNNMIRRETYGVHDANGEGQIPLNDFAGVGGWTWINNDVSNCTLAETCESGLNAYPSGNGNIYESTSSWESEFVCYTYDGNPDLPRCAAADYHIATGQPAKGIGSDGKDIGADIDLVNTATAGVLVG